MGPSLTTGHQVRTPKLRNSCDECTATKVGCSKEKPTCARCAKRELPCAYSATKRAGRTARHKSQAAKNVVNNAVSSVIPWTSPTSTATQTPNSITGPSTTSLGAGISPPWPDLSQPSTRQLSPSYSDSFGGLLLRDDPFSSLMPTASPTDLDELVASVVSLPSDNASDWYTSAASPHNFGYADFINPNTPNYHGSNNHNISSRSSSSNLATNNSNNRSSVSLFPESGRINASPVSEESLVLSQDSDVGRPAPNDNGALAAAVEALPGGQGLSDSSCHCLMRALGFLAQLHPSIPEGSTTGTTNDDSLSQLHNFEIVVAQNEQTVEAVTAILQCQCSNDGYLLAILSLVVFSILTWYTAAAGASLNGDKHSDASEFSKGHYLRSSALRVMQGPSTSVGGFDSEGEDQQRMAAQLILSRLLGVQRLVNLLSQRLQHLGEKSQDDERAGAAPPKSVGKGVLSSLLEEESFALPLSAKLAYTLEADMRERLSDVSRAIVETLRRG